MSLMLALAGAKMGAEILGAHQQKKYAGKFAKLEKEKASFYAEYNQDEIERAYQANINQLVRGYLDQRRDLTKQTDQAQAELALHQAAMSASVESSSFSNDAEQSINTEFMNGLANITEQQILNSSEMVSQRQQQTLQNQVGLQRTLLNINQTTNQVIANANTKMLGSMLEFGMTAGQEYTEGVETKTAKDNINTGKSKGLNFGWLKRNNPFIKREG